VDFAVASSVLVALMAYYHMGPGRAVVFLPLVLLVHVAFTASVALLLAMANLFYRDVKYLFEVVISIWMFLSSVLYPVDRVGGSLGILLKFNPMTQIIDAYRSVLLLGRTPSLAFFATGAAAAVLLAVSWMIFHRAEFTFAENV
jgi:lipopolysaccharide transport system permease protein